MAPPPSLIFFYIGNDLSPWPQLATTIARLPCQKPWNNLIARNIFTNACYSNSSIYMDNFQGPGVKCHQGQYTNKCALQDGFIKPTRIKQ